MSDHNSSFDVRGMVLKAVFWGVIVSFIFVAACGIAKGVLWAVNWLEKQKTTSAATETIYPAANLPRTYIPFFPEDSYYANLELKPGARQVHPATVNTFMVPVAYGGSKALSGEPCMVIPEGLYTKLKDVDDNNDGIIEDVIVVYTAPPYGLDEPDLMIKNECSSYLVFRVSPTEFEGR